MKKSSFLFAILMLTSALYGQRFDSQALTTATVSGTAGLAKTVPFAVVTVCTSGNTLGACVKASLCTDATLGTCGTTGPYNPITADGSGNFGWYALNGNYVYFITNGGSTSGPYNAYVPTNPNATVFNNFSVTKMYRDCRLDGVVADGTTDDGGHINTCITNAVAANTFNIKLPSGSIHIVTPINAVNLHGMTISGSGSDYYNYSTANGLTVLMCDTATVCLDIAGSRAMKVENLVLRIANTYSTPSNVAVLEGRTGSGGGTCFSEDIVWDRVNIWTDHNSAINSTRGYIGIYNVGGEVRKYTGGYIQADTPMMFMTTNVLNLTSPYETLGTGCAQSMTVAKLANMTLQSTYGSAIEAWTTADFSLDQIVFLMAAGTDTRFVSPLEFHGTYATNWHVNGHVETLRTNNSLMSWGATTMQGNTFNFNLGGSTALGDTHGYIAWPSAGFTAGENTVVLDLHNEPAGYERPFFSNASAETINGGKYVMTGSKKSLSATNITLNGTKIIGTDFTSAQIAFNAASSYEKLTSGGWIATSYTASTGITGSGATSYVLGGSTVVGTSPTTPACVASHVCNQVNGSLSFTSGTGPSVPGAIVKVTFPVTRTNIPDCTVNAYDVNTGAPLAVVQDQGTATTSFVWFASLTTLTASHVYNFTYFCGGN